MSDQYIQEVAQALGNFPFIYYGSYQIDVHDIKYFNLYYKGSLPCFELSFYDTLNLMKDTAMPLDDAKIKVFLNPRSQQLKEILIQFKITQFTVNNRRYSMKGVLDVNNLHISLFKSYENMTSHKTLQSIAKESGLGFNTNIDDTDDSMTWIQTGEDTIDFIEEIVESSYKSDNAFMAAYIDYYYNFNFIDIEKELERNIDNDLTVTDRTLSDVLGGDEPEKLSNLILSNDEAFRDTNLFFDNYRVINNSTGVSLLAGYKNIINYYDISNKNLLVFNIDSITSKGDKTIILKGSPQDEEFFKLNNNFHFLGTMDVSNSHKNYKFSQIQNEKNLIDLGKIGLEITMSMPNYSLYKYQKVKLFLSNQATTPSAGIKNERLSGDWLIIDIQYTFSQNNFNQTIKLVKRELELSDAELLSESPQQKNDKGENTINPEVASSNNENPIIPGTTSSVVNTPSTPGDVSDILTKEIWRRIYNGKVNQKVIETMYAPTVNALIKYGMNTKERICAFLSQINIETGYLKFVTELASGSAYNDRADLGNGPNDGPKYKGRGLIQITGKSNYKAAGQFLNKDFVNNPDSVAAENNTHIKAADSTEQLDNSALVSVRYWIAGSDWGNLNSFADNMDLKKPIDTGIYSQSGIPNTQGDAKNMGFKVKKKNNFSTDANSSNSNLEQFTLICFGVNGGYNGYKDRINNWNGIRQYFV